jgi:nickel/cobalt exporter
MNPIHLAEQAGSNPWLFLAAALLLGAFHGLEPGHSKGIMTAFILGTRGSYAQAVVLALSATLSHTAIVWILAWPASYGGTLWTGLAFSPWLNLISGVVVLGLAYWMLRKFNRANRHGHPHGHGHHHDHPPGDTLSMAMTMEEDEHTRLHMREIAGKFSDQQISTLQVIVFGLTTGLAPCTAAIVILITCFRLHQPWLGLGMVTAFSVGLGLTLTSVALLASWGVRTLGSRTRGFQDFVRKAPFFSALVTAAIGIYLIIQFFRSY